MNIGDVEWTDDPGWHGYSQHAELSGSLRLQVIDGCEVPDDPEAARPCWYVEGGDDASGWGVLASGKADNMTAARIAAYDGWRRWAREQAEAAGLTDPVEPEVGGGG